jgi:RimJ/RimL family protein N-acetyltransferase
VNSPIHIFLGTNRLILREFTPGDVDLLVELNSDPEVTRFTFQKAMSAEFVRDKLLPEYLSYYQNQPGFGYWAAVEKASEDFLGWFHFRPSRDNPDEIELGYRLRQSAWGQGYATEGSRALIAKGIAELGVKRVVATAIRANAASVRVMEKAGLTFEKTFFYEGIAEEAVKYGLGRDSEEQA